MNKKRMETIMLLNIVMLKFIALNHSKHCLKLLVVFVDGSSFRGWQRFVLL